jgi:hypothetical protein
MNARPPRLLGLAATMAGTLWAIIGCSAHPASSGAAGISAYTSPAATASSTLRSSPAGPAGSNSNTSAPTTGVTSTPGLQLRGPQPLPVSQHVIPTRVLIPAIGVDSTLEPLQTKDGVLQPPTNPLRAGWWTGGPIPGDPGAAVIAGHLDSYTGPAVFIYLSELHAGDLIDVSRSDG